MLGLVEKWTGEHHAFAIKVYYRNGDSIMHAQHLFHCHFQINCIDPVPPIHAINSFQSNFSATRILPSSYLFWAGKRLMDYL
jgi:hypothetical protein